MNNLRGVWFKIDFIFNFIDVDIRKIWIIFFFMSCKWKGSTRDSRGVLNVRDIISILRDLPYFSKKGVPRTLYLLFATAKGITSVRMLPWIEV